MASTAVAQAEPGGPSVQERGKNAALPNYIPEAQDLSVDPNLLEGSGSDYESGSNTETTSISTSIVDYVYENGRRYHRYREGSYPMPNDETEQDRLDLHHHIFTLLQRGKLFFAPIPTKPQAILDVGTGTGIWALDIAEMYPSAQIIGTDLSPIQPSWVYPNVSFLIDDCEADWGFAEDNFDLVHSRNLVHAIRDWPRFFRQAFRATKPGGYIETVELQADACRSDDGSMPNDGAVVSVFRLAHKALRAAGIEAPGGKTLKKYCEDAGFVEVQLITLKQPFGPWPADETLKRAGACFLGMADTVFEAYNLALLTRVMGMEVSEAKAMFARGRKEFFNKRIHMYNYFWHIVGRKPGGVDEVGGKTTKEGV